MQSDDKPVNAQQNPNSPNFLDLLDQTPPPPATGPDKDPGTNLAQLRAAWTASWEQGGFLHRRWEELRQVPQAGWHGMANWVKAGLSLIGISLAIIIVTTAADIIADLINRLLAAGPTLKVGTDTGSGVWGVIDNPIRSYIATHSADLPISASTVYTLWQALGLFSLIGGFITRSNGARLTWLTWGCAGVAMIWTTTPETAQTVATGLAVLAWTVLSTFALRGLSLRPSVFIHTAPEIRNDIRPEIHIPAPAAPPGDDAPDNVHPLHKR